LIRRDVLEYDRWIDACGNGGNASQGEGE